ncbi:Uncharacterised protein [Burkholderia oklahomensis]|nr:hypothetical protein BG90_2793 [Burkholderia oklahomensis C6786]SUW56581.1 Uncharacterised protein [Burkholderia oklahomensis]
MRKAVILPRAARGDRKAWLRIGGKGRAAGVADGGRLSRQGRRGDQAGDAMRASAAALPAIALSNSARFSSGTMK